MIDSIKNVATSSAKEIEATMNTHKLPIIGALREASKNKRGTVILWAILTIIFQCVLGIFAFLGADWVISGYGRWVSLGVTATGALFVVLTATKLFTGRAKWFVLVAELVLMTFNAYVSPGFFGQSNIGTQFDKISTNYHQETEKIAQEIGSFTSTFGSIANLCENIKAAEIRRDGVKGDVYQTAEVIGSSIKAQNVSTEFKILKPQSNESVESLEQLNRSIISVKEHYSTQVSDMVKEAKSTTTQIKGFITAVESVLSNGSLNSMQKGNLTQLKSMLNEIDGEEFEYTLSARTASREDLEIPRFFKALPFILDIIVLLLMFQLIRSTDPKEDLLEQARRESELSLLKRFLDDLGIDYDDNITASPKLLRQLDEISFNNDLLKLVDGRNVDELTDILEKKDSLKHALDSSNTYTQEQIESMKNDGITDTTIQKIIDAGFDHKDVQFLKEKTGQNFNRILTLDAESLKISKKFVRKLSKLNNVDDEAKEDFIEDVFEDIEMNKQSIKSVLEMMDIIEDDKKLAKIDWRIVNHMNDETSELLIHILQSCLTDKVRGITKNWNRTDNNILSEIIRKGLVTGNVKMTLGRCARGGYSMVSNLLKAYQTKKESIDTTDLLDEVNLIVTTNTGLFKQIASEKNSIALSSLLESVFEVPNPVAE